MSPPLVSICLPNLNTRPYLQERVDTILRQTYVNWELIVSDNYSDDGAWELFQELAQTDGRVAIAQAPREGMYPNWNRCIRRARGEYVYIATSDDTMPPDCLETLVAALETHPECDVAHCRLRPIDEKGGDAKQKAEWWSHGSVFARSSGPLLHHLHVRRPPFDGLLHLLGGTVYVSITQLLIRRSLFDRIGLFESAWGSVGDFNWNMRAGLVASAVHVPETWGGWRLHPSQATAHAGLRSAEHARRIDEMIDHAIATCGGLLSPGLRQCLSSRWSPEARELRAFNHEVARRRSAIGRRSLIARRALAGSVPARERLKAHLSGRSFPDVVRSWLEDVGFGPVLLPAARRHGRAVSYPGLSAGGGLQAEVTARRS